MNTHNQLHLKAKTTELVAGSDFDPSSPTWKAID